MSTLRTKILDYLFRNEGKADEIFPANIAQHNKPQKTADNALKSPPAKKTAEKTAAGSNSARTQSASDATKTADLKQVTEAGFESHLLDLLSAQPACMIGRLNLIGLHQLRDALGKRWEHVQGRIHEKVQSILHKNLAREDVFVRRSDVEYMICHANLSDQQARMKSIQIAQEIMSFFLGTTELEKVSIRTAVACADGSIKFEELTFDDINHEEELAKAATASDTVGRANNIKTQPISNSIDIADIGLSSTITELASINRLDYCDFLFRSVWHSKQNVLVAHHILPRFSHDLFGERTGYLQTRSVLKENEQQALDFLILAEAVDVCAELISNLFMTLVVIPLDFETMTSPRLREKYLAICRQIPAKIREMIVFQIYDLPDGAPSSRVQSVAQTIKPFCRYVFASVGIAKQSYRNFENTGLDAICLIPPKNFGSQKPSAMAKQLLQLVTQCKATDMIPCLEDVADIAMLKLGVDAGVIFIAGDVISKPSFAPGHMARCTFKDIVAQNASASASPHMPISA